jgi:hypothetical protein
LHFAVAACDKGLVQHVFREMTADELQRDSIGHVSPLHMAAVLGDPEIVSVLLDSGSLVDPKTDEVRSLLFFDVSVSH